MKHKFSGSIVELDIVFNIEGHTHSGMLLDCTGQRLIFVEMSAEELRKMPLYSNVNVWIETLPFEQNPTPELGSDEE